MSQTFQFVSALCIFDVCNIHKFNASPVCSERQEIGRKTFVLVYILVSTFQVEIFNVKSAKQLYIFRPNCYMLYFHPLCFILYFYNAIYTIIFKSIGYKYLMFGFPRFNNRNNYGNYQQCKLQYAPFFTRSHVLSISLCNRISVLQH